jgi:hypothetical protein
VEPLEERCQPSATGPFRPIDEVGNNQTPGLGNLGTAGTDLLRISPPAYTSVANGGDGLNTPSLANYPGARALSDILNNQLDPNNPGQDVSVVDQNSLSAFGYVWGQFIDHDMDLTPDGGASLPIQVPAGDPIGGAGPLPFSRSQFDPNTGTSNPRQQVNAVTSFLDLSQVYGSTTAVANALRTFSGGLLKTSPGADGIIGTADDLLPYNNATYFSPTLADPDPNQLAELNMANDSGAVSSGQLFAAGDRRANENIELTALQTLFVRNHNLIATALQQQHPDWSDEQLYQEARKLNIAEEQIITYTQYLPDLLGPTALPAYTGYNPKVNPAIATEFSTVAFRFGHSLLDSDIERHANNGLGIADVNPNGATIPLAEDFFRPDLINPNGPTVPLSDVDGNPDPHTPSDIGALLKGSADGNAQAMDLLAVEDVRNLLFGNGQFGGQDLIARDIQRARDHGIGTYNQVRVAYGLPPITDDATHGFDQITSNVQVQQQLEAAYASVIAAGGTAGDIDPFEAGLAEDHVNGSDMGPLFTKILADQFTRLATGDRFFFLNETWNREELKFLLQGLTLGQVITANTGVTNLQLDVFKFRASISGTVFNDRNGDGRQGRGEAGLSGLTVELEDDSGAMLATTTTDGKGRYSFNQFSGVSGTGNYTVVLVGPSGSAPTTANPVTILISRGGLDVDGVNFGVDLTSPAPSVGGATTAPSGTGSAPPAAAPTGGAGALAAAFAAASPGSATPGGPPGGGSTASTNGGTGPVVRAVTPGVSGSGLQPASGNSLTLVGAADTGQTTADGLDPTAVDALVQTLGLSP